MLNPSFKEGKRSKALRTVAKFVESKSGTRPPKKDEMQVNANTFGKFITMDDILTNIENEELPEEFNISQRIEGDHHTSPYSR